MTELLDTGPGDAFAALMSKAEEIVAPPADPAPFGYMIDPVTGETRPKKAPGGGRRRTPSIEDLKAAQTAPPNDGEGSGAPTEVPGPDKPRDTPPGAAKAKAPVLPMPSTGIIAKGVNKLYRRAGKIVRAMDADIGEAIIQSARNTGDDGEDDSVGAAWEELAKTNPRIRRFLLKCLEGGAWGALLMAHAPIAMAILLKPGVMRFIPFSALLESLAEPDDDQDQGDGGLPGGMTMDDLDQAKNLAVRQMEQMGMSVPPEVADAMAKMAAANASTTIRQQQPRRRTRAKR